MSAAQKFRIDSLPKYMLGSLAQSIIEARVSGRDIIDVSQINPSVGVPSAANEKLVQAILQPHNHKYTSSQGITALREAVAEKYKRDFLENVDAQKEIVVTMGIKEGLGHMLMAVLNPGDKVLLPSPSYPIHSAAIAIAGAQAVPVSLDEIYYQDPDSIVLDEDSSFFDNLKNAISQESDKPRAIVCSFPHNPSAAVVTRGFVQRFVDICRLTDIYIFHDFAYSDLCFEDYRAPSFLDAEGAREVVVEFSSLSKTHSLPGWRLGYAAGNEELISALKKIKSYLDFGVFQPVQIAAIDALRDEEDFCSSSRNVFQNRRDALVEGLASIGWQVPCPKASLFVWARLPEAQREMGSLKFSQELLKEAGVAVCPGEGFDPRAREYVRFSLGEEERRLRQAVKLIGEFISR